MWYMIKKHTRNTVAGRWADKYSCSIHKAIIYRNRLKKHIKFGCEKTPEQETFLTCLAKSYYHFAIYYYQNSEWLLCGTNDHWAFRSPEEVAEFANEHLIPYHLLNDDFAKECKVPITAIQLLLINKHKVKL